MFRWLSILTLAIWTCGLTRGSDSSTDARLPDDEPDLAQTAVDYFHAGRYASAEAIYEKMTHAHPDSIHAWSNLGVVRFQAALYASAKEAFQRALRLQPKDELCLADLGSIDYEMKLYQDAINALRSAVTLNPGDAHAHRILAAAYEKMAGPVMLTTSALARRIILLRCREPLSRCATFLSVTCQPKPSLLYMLTL